MLFKPKPKPQGFCWQLVSQGLLELTGIITPILLAGVGWLVYSLPQQLHQQETQLEQVIQNQEELKDKIANHELLLRQQDIRLTREELRN